MNIKVIVLCALTLWLSEAYRLLVVFPLPSRSHGRLGDGVVRHLLKAGHEVTYITVFKYKDPPGNLRQIDISENVDLWAKDLYNLSTILADGTTGASDFNMIKEIVIGISVKTMETKNVQKLITDPEEKFDAVLIEWVYLEFTAGLSTIFDAPLIWIHPVEVWPDAIGLIDEMPNPAYAPDLLGGELAPLTFWKRVLELWVRVKIQYLKAIYYDVKESEEFDRLFAPIVRMRGREPPTFSEVRYNASLVLGNSHVSTGQALSLPQAYKPIGGYHIDEYVDPLPEVFYTAEIANYLAAHLMASGYCSPWISAEYSKHKALPPDLKKIMDSAKHGVIYFSMGSNVKSKDWPEEIKTGLLKMFGELKQIVLWKFEEVLPNLPKNVHILQWAPQLSILAHPNCILFITHGGLLSVIETMHYAVPVIGIPVHGDQFVNVNMAVAKGYAVKVDLTYNLVSELKSAIEEITRNPRYSERVKELSFIYHDRPTKPGAELVHWVQHVVRTRGAPHLRSPALSTPLYQRLYFDLIATVIVATVTLLVILRWARKTVKIGLISHKYPFRFDMWGSDSPKPRGKGVSREHKGVRTNTLSSSFSYIHTYCHFITLPSLRRRSTTVPPF